MAIIRGSDAESCGSIPESTSWENEIYEEIRDSVQQLNDIRVYPNTDSNDDIYPVISHSLQHHLICNDESNNHDSTHFLR